VTDLNKIQTTEPY